MLCPFLHVRSLKGAHFKTIVCLTQVEKCGTTKGCKDACLLVVFHFIEGEQLGNQKQDTSFWTKLGRLIWHYVIINHVLQSSNQTRFFKDLYLNALAESRKFLSKNRSISGVLVGNLSVAMSEIKHSAFHRDHSWDPLIADKGLIEDQPYFPSERLPKLNVSYYGPSPAYWSLKLLISAYL